MMDNESLKALIMASMSGVLLIGIKVLTNLDVLVWLGVVVTSGVFFWSINWLASTVPPEEPIDRTGE